jgi:predicted hotdog family 3-hydroxylacyl-ACP dehydratase
MDDLRLEDLLPHRGRMLLVDDVVEVDSSHAVTRCVVDKSWPLVRDNAVHPLVLLELAAQTAGVCNGWDRIQTQGLDSNQMGWLVAIKKAEFFIDRLPLGSAVIARAENTYNFENLREVACTLRRDGALIARTTLQLFQALTYDCGK